MIDSAWQVVPISQGFWISKVTRQTVLLEVLSLCLAVIHGDVEGIILATTLSFKLSV